MNETQIKKLIKNEIVPYLIGLRNDLQQNIGNTFIINDKEIKVKNEKGDSGDTPIKDKDYPSLKTVESWVKDIIPVKGKDYFTDNDIKEIALETFKLIPSKDELKGKDGEVDYPKVQIQIESFVNIKDKEIKKEIKQLEKVLFNEITKAQKPELKAEQIRDKLESLSGSDRLDAKAIKGLEKYMQTFIATSSGGGGGGGSTPDLSGYLKLDQTTPQTIINTEMTGQSVQFMDGTYAIRTIGGKVYFDNATSGFYSHFSTDTYAGDFYDGVRSVTLANGTYAINASGDSYFNGKIGIGDTTNPVYPLDVGGTANFTDGFDSVLLVDGDYAINATGSSFFNNNGDSVTLTDGAYAINAVGVSYLNGNVGIGEAAPTAALHLKAGTATAGSAPLKFTSGTLLTNPESGVMEFLNETTGNFYLTVDDATVTTRHKIVLTTGVTSLTSTRVPFADATGRLQDSSALTMTTAGLMTLTGTATTDGLSVTGKLAIVKRDGTNGTTGTSGSAVFIAMGNGGASTASTGASAGAITFTGGAGGQGSYTTGSISGGAGTAFTFTGGTGGAVSGKTSCTLATGGKGGTYSWTGGTGGSASNTNTSSTGGAGGGYVFTAGAGGASTTEEAGTIHLGGNGGEFTFTGANGGNASNGSTSNTGGNGSTFTFQAGLGGTGATANGANGNFIWKSGSTEIARFDNTAGTIGRFGIGIAPTAMLTLKAGSATAGTAPLKFTSGTLLTNAEAGAVEFLTDKYYATIGTGTARKELTLNDIALTATRVPFATTNGRLTDDADFTFATDTLTVTKIVGTTSIKVGTAGGYISSDNSTGATGSFTTADSKTVTVKDGIITAIV